MHAITVYIVLRGSITYQHVGINNQYRPAYRVLMSYNGMMHCEIRDIC